MTVAPSRPPVFAAGDVNFNEIIDSPYGRMKRWRAATIATGEMSAREEFMKQFQIEFDAIRNDAAILQTQANELTANERALQDLAVKVVDVLQRADALIKRAEAFEERQRILNEEPFPEPPLERSSEPPLALEGDSIAGTELGEPSETHSKNDDELPVPPLEVEPIEPRSPVAAGFDKE